MLGSEGCKLKEEEITGKNQIVILGSIHSFRNCGPGAVVWLLGAKHLHLHMGVYFVSLLAPVCANSKQLDIPVIVRLVAAHAW